MIVNKAEIRKHYKQIRKNLTGEPTSELYKTNEYLNADVVFTFVSYGSEIDTKKLIKKAFIDGKRVAVPYMTGTPHEMVFIEIKSLDELVPNSIGILEPRFDESKVLAGSGKTVVIVPGLAFDKDFYRIGYGGGYYDKYLSENSCLCALGLCFEEQMTEYLPREATDIALDMIVTDRSIRRKNEIFN